MPEMLVCIHCGHKDFRITTGLSVICMECSEHMNIGELVGESEYCKRKIDKDFHADAER